MAKPGDGGAGRVQKFGVARLTVPATADVRVMHAAVSPNMQVRAVDRVRSPDDYAPASTKNSGPPRHRRTRKMSKIGVPSGIDGRSCASFAPLQY
jgi:hypothetical protein